MQFIKYFSSLIIIALIGSLLAWQFLFIRIDIGETGVRTQQYSFLGEKGVIAQDFGQDASTYRYSTPGIFLIRRFKQPNSPRNRSGNKLGVVTVSYPWHPKSI